jgi:hypothetical protein
MWPKEIPQFSAQNLNHHPGFELGDLEVNFGPIPMGKPDYGWMQNLILPIFLKRSTSIQVHMQKL